MRISAQIGAVLGLVGLLVLGLTEGKALAQNIGDYDGLSKHGGELFKRGQYAAALPLLQQAVAAGERQFGRDHPKVADATNLVGMAYLRLGRYNEAEPWSKRTVDIRERKLGTSGELALALNNLGYCYQHQKRYGEAEPLFKRALAIAEKVWGLEHPDVAGTLNNLALLYRDEGRYAEAEPLMKRALAIREKHYGPWHIEVARSVNSLAALYNDMNRDDEQEKMLRRSLEIRQKVLNPNDPALATALDNLATFYRKQGRLTDAEPLAKRALAIYVAAYGPLHPDVAITLNNLADLYVRLRREAEAVKLFKPILEIRVKTLGPDHPDVADALDKFAWVYFATANWDGAVEHWRRSAAIRIRRAQRDASDIGKPLAVKGESATVRASDQFFGLIKAAFRTKGASTNPGLAAEMFEIAQWAQNSEAALSLAQMAARGAKANRALSALIRERQDLVGEWRKLDDVRTSVLARPSSGRNAAAEAKLLAKIEQIDRRIAVIDAHLAAQFPDYGVFASAAPTTAREIQAALGQNEALVMFLDAPKMRDTPEEVYVWVITKTAIRWARSEMKGPALTGHIQGVRLGGQNPQIEIIGEDVRSPILGGKVRSLRCGLDLTLWAETKKDPCRRLLSHPDQPEDMDSLPFDVSRAHALYKDLFGQIEVAIKGKSLLIVPSGPLTQLPFQVLVQSLPEGANGPGPHYIDVKKARSVAWLAREYALTILPAASSLKALRRAGRSSSAPKTWLGFGNPLLDGPSIAFAEMAEQARATRACADTPGPRAMRLVSRAPVAALEAGDGLADVSFIRRQMPLPETALELCQVARAVHAEEADVYLGARAKEQVVKQLSATGELAKYRILHFATHGALAGEVRGNTEPGLILSPPEKASDDDDGYLTASEIAGLKLDADWVILSACNTAAGGASGADALSGLAKAFFYAQARALLVSHWAVDSNATVKLIAGAVGKLAADRRMGRAEAVRQAMLDLIDKGEPRESHPAVWAPFIVVGEGAAER